MIIVLSPAKSLDFETSAEHPDPTQPEFVSDAAELIAGLRALAPAQIASLMGVSEPLAQLNFDRFARWSPQFTAENARPAILAFNGDVYEGLAAASLGHDDLRFAQRHVRILSGLYGVLRPLDLMQPYRLEMGTRWQTARGKDLYAFWGDAPAAVLERDRAAAGAPALINLASEEYFRAVRKACLGVPVITPVFEDWKGGRYKIISYYAKRARGLMTRYALTRRLTDPQALKRFDTDGYAFDAGASDTHRWVFRRRAEA
jgi:cytoplasmic iron level regulating protein YaaA (DUF328/UPF0246 family)